MNNMFGQRSVMVGDECMCLSDEIPFALNTHHGHAHVRAYGAHSVDSDASQHVRMQFMHALDCASVCAVF